MKFLQFLLLFGIAFGVYQYLGRSSSPSSQNGFVEVPMPLKAKEDQVLIVAALNCPKKAAQHAEFLARSLKAQGVPYKRVNTVEFQFEAQERKSVERLKELMKGPPPIVFYRGQGKSNPSYEDVIQLVQAP